MAEYKYEIERRDGTKFIADPNPTGWERPSIALQRDPVWHGLFFDYGLDRLTFTGMPAEEIKSEYDDYGVNGQMSMRIWYKCSEAGRYDILYTGKLNFTEYAEQCGNECNVSIGLEDSGDIMMFRNNYDQKVDLMKNIAFDQVTELTDYAGLNFDLTIPGRGLPVKVSGMSQAQQHPFYPINVTWPGTNNAVYIRPVLTQGIISEIEISDLVGENPYAINQELPNQPTGVSPILDLQGSPACYVGTISYNVRLKGHIRESTNGPRTVTVQAVVTNLDSYINTGSAALDKTTISTGNYAGGTGPDLDFDVSFSGTATLNEDQRFRVFLFVTESTSTAARTSNIWVDWDAETFVNLTSISECEETDAKSFMINEVASRTVEAITNDAIRFYSQSFGRTDSQPYAIGYDSCAGLYAITSGLNIRQRLLPDGTQPGFFKSMREVFEDLRSMWNIGLNIEPDPARSGYRRLRFENWEYYYQNDRGLFFRYPDTITKEVDLSRIFNRMSIGFPKWEAENFAGLDEFMTVREYRLDVNAVDNGLNVLCNTITSPYTVEITRRQNDNSADWKYDNDTFGFCLYRGPEGLAVEQFQGRTSGVENISNPDTAYNQRVRPSVNAMRWFNYVVQGIKRVTAATKLLFTSGTGNYIAKLKAEYCNIEGEPIAENEDISIIKFDSVLEAQPITQPEIDRFTHAMDFTTFRRLQNEPSLMFKAIVYICNNIQKEGWIKSLTYDLEEGTAALEVIPKNELQIPVPAPPCTAMISNIEIMVTDNNSGTIDVDFTESAPGADNWQWQVINQVNDAVVQTGTATSHPFQITGLLSSFYAIRIIPFCGVAIGANLSQAFFTIEEQEMNYIISTAKVSIKTGWRWRLTIVRAGGGLFENDFTFKFGACQTSDSGTICYGFPSSTSPSSDTELNAFAGQSSVSRNTNVTTTPTGTLDSITLHGLVGITPAQISLAPGETITLNFE